MTPSLPLKPTLLPLDAPAVCALFNSTRQTLVAARVVVARSWPARLRGLLGRRALLKDEGMLFPACRAIHTWGMQFALDVVALGPEGRVVQCVPQLPPWRLFQAGPTCWAILELSAGALCDSGTTPGDGLIMVEAQR